MQRKFKKVSESIEGAEAIEVTEAIEVVGEVEDDQAPTDITVTHPTEPTEIQPATKPAHPQSKAARKKLKKKALREDDPRPRKPRHGKDGKNNADQSSQDPLNGEKDVQTEKVEQTENVELTEKVEETETIQSTEMFRPLFKALPKRFRCRRDFCVAEKEAIAEERGALKDQVQKERKARIEQGRKYHDNVRSFELVQNQDHFYFREKANILSAQCTDLAANLRSKSCAAEATKEVESWKKIADERKSTKFDSNLWKIADMLFIFIACFLIFGGIKTVLTLKPKITQATSPTTGPSNVPLIYTPNALTQQYNALITPTKLFELNLPFQVPSMYHEIEDDVYEYYYDDLDDDEFESLPGVNLSTTATMDSQSGIERKSLGGTPSNLKAWVRNKLTGGGAVTAAVGVGTAVVWWNFFS